MHLSTVNILKTVTDRTHIADFVPSVPLHILKLYRDNVQIELQQSYEVALAY